MLKYMVIQRTRRPRRRTKNASKYIRRKKSSTAQQNQLLRLNSQVNRINRKIAEQTIWKQFYMENVYAGSPNGTPFVLPYKFYVVPLTRPDNWVPCFQSRGDVPR